METDPGGRPRSPHRKRARWLRQSALLRRRAGRMSPALEGLLWAGGAGFTFVVLNTLMRQLALQMSPVQVQFLRYLFGLLVMLPLIVRAGAAAYWPRNVAGQLARGALHATGLFIWFAALSHVTLADTTVIGFTQPIFIMLGAAWLFRERMRADRWLAACVGLGGVLIVVAPKLSGTGGLYTLLMAASTPVFAASFLFTKSLTRYERPAVIVVWQAITVTLFSLPPALMAWQAPTPWEWAAFVLCGLLGSFGHYMLTRSFGAADISATQSVRFLDLVWAALLGWLAFGDWPSRSTLIGGTLICVSTLWIARREARRRA